MANDIIPTDQTPDNLKAELRAMQAMQLRVEGLTYEAIAKELGYKGRSGAYNAVARLLSGAKYEGAKEARALLFARLEALIEEHWPNKSDPKAAQLILSVCDQEARLLGLYTRAGDAGQESVAKVYIGVDFDEI